MLLPHVSSNLRQGLRRNLSMHVAVILTLFVSLSLAGLGTLVVQQSQLTEEALGNELTLGVYLCATEEPDYPQCTGPATEEQTTAIEEAIEASPETAGQDYRSQQEEYDRLRDTVGPEPFEGDDPIVAPEDVPARIIVTLEDPDQFAGVLSAIQDLPGFRSALPARDLVGPVFESIDALRYGSWGLAGVLVIAAILLVANTIRLAALARRKEIEIMRLVGASRIFIALPFLLEGLVTGLLGGGLAAGALAAFTGLDAIEQVFPFPAIPYVGWDEFLWSGGAVLIAGPVLTIVPTLLVTRKYLRL